eukprot:COSAG03_NODE_1232_length_4510_cov_37.532986_2_plen_361_part_00
MAAAGRFPRLLFAPRPPLPPAVHVHVSLRWPQFERLAASRRHLHAGCTGGYSSSARAEQPCARLASALPKYVEEHGHGWVPAGYLTADGYELGADAVRARQLARKRRLGGASEAALLEAGFELDYKEHQWNRAATALLCFRGLHGHLRVPFAFAVPEEEPWPRQCWGMALGKRVNRIRGRQDFVLRRPERREWLDKQGFVWEEREHRWTEEIQPALQCFRGLHGHLRVPRPFVVPEEAVWPQQCWGMRLGETVNRIRTKEGHPERREWLDCIGFVWDEPEHKWSHEVQPALQCFRGLHGHLRVPFAFAVPEEEPWPRQCWGMALGRTVSGIRSRQDFVLRRPERREWLDKQGFVWGGLEH